MFDPTKVAALKTLGFSDDDITSLQTQAEATEKAATDQGVAYKADEPARNVTINLSIPANAPIKTAIEEALKAFPPFDADKPGHYEQENGKWVFKAFPPKAAVAVAAPVEGSPEEEAAESPEEEAAEPDAMMDDAGGLTLSPEDISAIGQALSDALTTALGPLVSTMDLTNKIGSHMNDLKTMMGGYQATKDAEAAETKEQIATLTTKVAELTGDQPAAPYRASAARDNVLTDATMLAAAKQLADPTGADPWADVKKGFGIGEFRPQ